MEENRTLPAASGLDQRVKTVAGNLFTRLRAMPAPQRRWLGISVALAVATAAGILWYAARPDWRVLFAGLDPGDAREMAAQLTAASIPFDVSPDGATLRVPAENLDKARLATTSKGGPHSGRMGFELFDKPNWIGSEFDEKVNYQRALEGELEHTIGSMGAVASARVHLALPQDSLFADQQKEAKASVVLKLRRRSLGDDDADAVRNLVASAVQDLRPENVVLVDADGHGTLGRRSADAESQSHEQALAAKLIETLEPVAGAGNVRASVNVDYDSSSTDELIESYDPNAVVTLSMQRAEENSGLQPAATGVPGTASNAPNAKPPLFPTAQSGNQNQKQESATYGASKKTRHVVQGVGKVRRITAALVINDRLIPAAGKGQAASWKPRSADEMKRITELAQTVIGFDTARGDQISVENIAFDSNSSPAVASLGDKIWKTTSEAGILIKYGTILVSMGMLILLVLRPLMRGMKGAPVMVATRAALPSAPPAAALPEAERPAQKLQAQVLFDTVSDQMRREPAQSSRLVQSWIHAE
jgi:flagellar M-ring protein FliF